MKPQHRLPMFCSLDSVAETGDELRISEYWLSMARGSALGSRAGDASLRAEGATLISSLGLASSKGG